MKRNQAIHIVTGVIGSDVHNVGITILEHALKAEGYQVVSLGIQVSQEEFINAAIETNAFAILISSIYGHAELDCKGMREKCIESGLKDILLYIGGNLAVGKQNWNDVESCFLDMGFNHVFPPKTDPLDVLRCLKMDIKSRRIVNAS